MNYGLELNKILDKCNLSEEERKAFEEFMDGKVYKDGNMYPDWYKKLSELTKTDPILDSAQKKLHMNNLWDKIIALCQKTEWDNIENE